MAFSIVPIVLRIFLRLVWGLGVFGTLKRLKSRRLRPEKVLFKNFFVSAFVYLGGGLVTSKIANIYFSDLGRKIEGGFGLRGDNFLNGPLLGVFPAAILLSLGMDGRPQTIAEQIDQD